jgi:hypothetical protein
VLYLSGLVHFIGDGVAKGSQSGTSADVHMVFSRLHRPEGNRALREICKTGTGEPCAAETLRRALMDFRHMLHS